MAYAFSGGCASSGGFGCAPWDDFFLDSSKIEYANQIYREIYGRDITERVASGLRNQSGYCTRDAVYKYVQSHPPISTDQTAGEVLEKKPEADAPPPAGFTPPAMPPASGGLPSWALPAAAAGVGLLAIVLVMKRKRKAA